MTGETRVLVIRSLQSEFVFMRHALPQGTKGVVLKDGHIISPDEKEMEMLLAKWGPAAKPGDRAQITKIDIKDNKIVLEINGGPKKKSKWYEHIQVGMGSGTVQAPPSDLKNPKGSVVELAFDKFVPEMTGDDVRALLAPVFDFKAKSAAEAYIDTVPPKVKDAIKNHQVLVGMNHEMVTYAVGRPERKIREKDESGGEYEEWMYGQPPQQVQFVRFVGDEVVQLKIMKVDGEKIVRTEREVELPKVAEQKPQEKAPDKPMKRPSLKRQGEDSEEQPLPQGGKGTTVPGATPLPPPTSPPTSQLPPG
jgi:hypothetical protein